MPLLLALPLAAAMGGCGSDVPQRAPVSVTPAEDSFGPAGEGFSGMRSAGSAGVAASSAAVGEAGRVASEDAILAWESPPASSGTSPPPAPRPTLASPSELAVDQGDPLAAVRAQGSGRVVVVFMPSEGWSYEGPDGRLTGVTVEILQDFFAWVEDREGVALEVTWAPDDDWARFYRRVRNGSEGVFGLGNVTITQERRGELDFSPPYLNNVAVLITHADVPELASLDDAPRAFEGFTAHPYRATLHEERVNRLREQRIPGLRVLPLESNDEILASVASSPDRLAWIDVHAYWSAVDRGLPLRRHPAGDDTSETFGVILPRGSDWTPLLSAFFEEGEGYRNEPRYLEILTRHLGQELAELLQEAQLSRTVPPRP